MKRVSLYLAAMIAAVALAAGLAACGSSDDNDNGGGGGGGSFDLTIGDSLPLTGDLADFGPPGNKAAKWLSTRSTRRSRRTAPSTP